MSEAVHKTGNSVLVDNYAQRTALRLGVTPDSVRTEFKKPTAQARFTSPGEEAEESFESAAPVMTRPGTHEFWLLKLLLVSDEAVAVAVGRVQPGWIQHATVREIVTRRLALQESGQWHGFAAFLSEFDLPETGSLMSEAASDDRKIPDPEKQVLDVALRLRNQSLDRQRAQLVIRQSQPGVTSEEVRDLQRQRDELLALKSQPI